MDPLPCNSGIIEKEEARMLSQLTLKDTIAGWEVHLTHVCEVVRQPLRPQALSTILFRTAKTSVHLRWDLSLS